MSDGGKDRCSKEFVTGEVISCKFGSAGYDPFTGFVMNSKIVDDMSFDSLVIGSFFTKRELYVRHYSTPPTKHSTCLVMLAQKQR